MLLHTAKAVLGRSPSPPQEPCGVAGLRGQTCLILGLSISNPSWLRDLLRSHTLNLAEIKVIFLVVIFTVYFSTCLELGCWKGYHFLIAPKSLQHRQSGVSPTLCYHPPTPSPANPIHLLIATSSSYFKMKSVPFLYKACSPIFSVLLFSVFLLPSYWLFSDINMLKFLLKNKQTITWL